MYFYISLSFYVIGKYILTYLLTRETFYHYFLKTMFKKKVRHEFEEYVVMIPLI